MKCAVTLGLCRVSNMAAEAEATDLGWLSASEQSRLVTIRSPRRRREFLAGRLALRRIVCAAYSGDPLRDWLLDAPENASPRLHSQPSSNPVHLGLSHSGDWLLCGTAACPLGVDIEQIRTGRDHAGVIGMVCSPNEQRRLAACGPHELSQQFTCCWTLKEAWLKAHGEGIASYPLEAIETEMEPITANAWFWRLDDMVLAVCLPFCDVDDVSWSFGGECVPCGESVEVLSRQPDKNSSAVIRSPCAATFGIG